VQQVITTTYAPNVPVHPLFSTLATSKTLGAEQVTPMRAWLSTLVALSKHGDTVMEHEHAEHKQVAIRHGRATAYAETKKILTSRNSRF